MRISLPAAVALALFAPAAGQAQECADEFAAIEKQMTGAALQAEYKDREASHPLVLEMKGGELIDLTGTIITATPYESWTGDSPVVDKVGGFLIEAKPLIEAKSEAECLALLEMARAEIEAFDEKMSGAPDGDIDAAADQSAAPSTGDAAAGADAGLSHPAAPATEQTPRPIPAAPETAGQKSPQ